MRVTIGNKWKGVSSSIGIETLAEKSTKRSQKPHPAFSPKKQMVILFQSVCKTLLNEVFAKLCSVTLRCSCLASNPF